MTLAASTVIFDDSVANSSVLAMNRSSDAAEMCWAASGALRLSVTRLPSGLVGLCFDLLILEVFQRTGMIGHGVLAIHRIKREAVHRRGRGTMSALLLAI